MKSLLRSKDWWKIVNGEEKEPEPPTKSSSSDPSILASSSKETGITSDEKDEDDPKFVKSLADWHKKNAEAIALFVCNIDPDLLDEIHVDDTAKAIWDHLRNQFGERGFTLRHTLFIHLMTSKLSDFNNLQDFQIDFKSTLSKLHESGEPLPKDLQIAAFLHGVEETYSQWAFAKRSTIRGKGTDDPLPTVDDLTAELMDESRANVRAEATALTATRGGYGQSRGRGNPHGRGGRGRRGGAPTSSQRSKLKCTHCKLEGHLEESCWKKYPKKAPNRNKSNESPSEKDEDSNKNPEKGKRKDGKLFAGSAVIVRPEINMTAINNSSFSSHIPSLTSPMALFAHKNSWYYDTGATNHLCNARDAFTSYTEFTTPQPIEGIGGSIMSLGIGTVRLNV